MKKFYEDEVYIKMCEQAILYLGQELEDGQRFLLRKGTYSIGEPCEGGREWMGGEVAFYSDEHDYLDNNDEYIPLWSQDQLQDMALSFVLDNTDKFVNSFGLLLAFVDWLHKFKQPNLLLFNSSLEILWLIYLMEIKYNKIWNGENWVKKPEKHTNPEE